MRKLVHKPISPESQIRRVSAVCIVVRFVANSLTIAKSFGKQHKDVIRADLDASPFIGEGHRKVCARLRILRSIRVSRARVLRLMRENALLSPHRRPQGTANLHDGTITTDRPNDMWSTAGIRIETVDQGWVWVFAAVIMAINFRTDQAGSS